MNLLRLHGKRGTEDVANYTNSFNFVVKPRVTIVFTCDDPIITSDNILKRCHKLIMAIVLKIEPLLCSLKFCVQIGDEL